VPAVGVEGDVVGTPCQPRERGLFMSGRDVVELDRVGAGAAVFAWAPGPLYSPNPTASDLPSGLNATPMAWGSAGSCLVQRASPVHASRTMT
jgi:hypothetical protein